MARLARRSVPSARHSAAMAASELTSICSLFLFSMSIDIPAASAISRMSSRSPLLEFALIGPRLLGSVPWMDSAFQLPRGTLPCRKARKDSTFEGVRHDEEDQ